jgi:heme-binding protein
MVARGRGADHRLMRKWLLVVFASLVVAFGLIQLVPYRVTDPPVQAEPKWDSPRTRALAVRACYDCHSNETRSEWYMHVAPASWWIKNHVDEGRAALNFSEWGSQQGEGADEAAESVAEGSMPPGYYTWFGLHGAARLTAAERDELVQGLKNTLGGG